MAGGGGDAKTGSSGLRSCPDSRGGVWSAIAPSFTPLKSSSWKESQRDLMTSQLDLSRCVFIRKLIKITEVKNLRVTETGKAEHAAASIVTSAIDDQILCRWLIIRVRTVIPSVGYLEQRKWNLNCSCYVFLTEYRRLKGLIRVLSSHSCSRFFSDHQTQNGRF